ncbi:preprotein translocase subunit SecY [Methanocella arvoryzae]|uniref:Protein translocase subunit SecY n=1 Tax=Methanocella arvoryzae (strain DSM 22066 / NBRC 105507 / MRE50) TaxID=351160 RepID=Q0W1W5_METAR|nr:preprotein translocase subunit SecY [Methanocella arvoryzae]CAJ37628.1 protein translocase, subunit Y [Methanocella arvoryzae MRE50]
MAETGLKDRIAPFLSKLPAVKRPEKHVHFQKKLMWTLGILVLYFVLSNISVFGLSAASQDLLGAYRAYFAGAQGSIILLGIGPIVMASIVLQLLVGAELIPLDTTDPKDQAIFQGLQKLMVFVMIVVEALPQIYGGFLLPDPAIAATLGVSTGIIQLLIFAQVALGGVLILYMDEIVSKWGIGSGVSLFIVAGIAQALVGGIFNWNPPYPGQAMGLNVDIAGLGARENLPIGIIFRWEWLLNNIGLSQLLTGENLIVLLYQGEILALLATIIIFLLIVYVESTRIEIPLAHAAVRGARGKFPVKLIYASVLPMILVRSLQATLEMVGLLLYRNGITFLGTFNQYNQPVDGLMFYINPINGLSDWVPQLAALNYPGIQLWQIALHVFTDAFILIAGGILFAIFWVETTGMGASRVARQIQKSGMQIPGFRRNEQVIEKVVSRYIPKVTVIGGAFVGFLTLLSSLFGILGAVSGTGMLLAVSITYQLYEKLASEQLMEMHPLMRKFLGEE